MHHDILHREIQELRSIWIILKNETKWDATLTEATVSKISGTTSKFDCNNGGSYIWIFEPTLHRNISRRKQTHFCAQCVMVANSHSYESSNSLSFRVFERCNQCFFKTFSFWFGPNYSQTIIPCVRDEGVANAVLSDSLGCVFSKHFALHKLLA